MDGIRILACSEELCLCSLKAKDKLGDCDRLHRNLEITIDMTTQILKRTLCAI